MGPSYSEGICGVAIAMHQLEQLPQVERAVALLVVLCKHIFELLRPEAALAVVRLAV